MAKVELLRSQKNQILELIKELELDPFNFEWTEYVSQFIAPSSVQELKYTGSDYFFIFDFKYNEHYAFFSPDYDRLLGSRSPGSWELQLKCVRDWLHFLKREIEEPDLWESLNEYALPKGTEVDPESENRSFTIPEAKQLTAGISKIRDYLEGEFANQEDELKIINEKLDYLCEAAQRQGRKDWFHTCIGVLFTLACSLSLSQEQGHALWTLLKATVSGIIKLLPR